MGDGERNESPLRNGKFVAMVGVQGARRYVRPPHFNHLVSCSNVAGFCSLLTSRSKQDRKVDQYMKQSHTTRHRGGDGRIRRELSFLRLQKQPCT